MSEEKTESVCKRARMKYSKVQKYNSEQDLRSRHLKESSLIFNQIMMFSLKKVDYLRVREREREEIGTTNSAAKFFIHQRVYTNFCRLYLNLNFLGFGLPIFDIFGLL